jgi:hypothetical protein
MLTFIILLPEQTHPGCSSISLKNHLGAAPPLERGIKLAHSLEADIDGALRYSPLEQTFFRGSLFYTLIFIV